MNSVEKKNSVIRLIYRDALILYSLLAISCVFAQEDYSRAMQQAISHKDYDRAMTLYYNAQADDYYDMESLKRNVVEVLYMKKEYAKADSLASALFDEDENSNITDLILICTKTKKYRQNINDIASIAMRIGSNPLDKSLLQDIEILDKDEVSKATKAITEYLNEDSKTNNETTRKNTYNPRPYNTVLTILYFYIGKNLEAYNSCIDYLTLENQPIIYYILGVLKKDRNEYLSAISFFSMAIKGGYNHYNCYLQRAICEGEEKDYKASNIDLDTCLMIDSNYYPLYLKGINYNYLHDYDRAMDAFDRSLAKNREFALCYNYRGIISSHNKNYGFAILDFRQAILLDKRTPFVHNNLGVALEKQGKITEAIKEYELSIKYEPFLSDAYYNLGRIYTDEKQTRRAIKYLKHAIKLDSEIADSHYLLGINYERQKKQKKACEEYHLSLELGHTLASAKIENYCTTKPTIVSPQDPQIEENELQQKEQEFPQEEKDEQEEPQGENN